MKEPRVASRNSSRSCQSIASILLFFLLYAGALSALFFHKLATRPLVLDEVFSFLQVADRALPEFFASFESGTNFLPYSYFAGLWTIDQMSSLTPLTLRLPSLIFAILAVVVFHFVLRRYFGDVIAFVACLGSLFVARDFVRYCCEARPYSLYVMMAALTLYTGALLLRVKEENWRPILLNGLVAFGLPSVHYVGIFYSLAAALALVLVKWRTSPPRFLTRAILSFVGGWAVFYVVHFTQIARLREDVTASDPTWIPVPTLQSSIGSFLTLLQLPSLVGLILLFGMGLVILKGSFPSVKQIEIARTPCVVFLFLTSLFWLLLPATFSLLAALGFPNLSLPRYFLPSVLGTGVMIGLLLYLFQSAYDPDPKLRKGIATAVVALGIVFLINQVWIPVRGAFARPGQIADFPSLVREQTILANNHHVFFPYLFYNFYGGKPGQILLLRRTKQEIESFKKLSPAIDAIDVGSLAQLETFTYLHKKCPQTSKSCMPEFDIRTWAKEHGYKIERHDTRRDVTEYTLSKR